MGRDPGPVDVAVLSKMLRKPARLKWTDAPTASAFVMYIPYVGPTAMRRKLWLTD